METFLIGFLSVAVVSFMFFTLGGRNTLYVFVAISFLGVLIGVFEDKDFSSSEEDKQFFVCSGTDTDYGTKYTYSLIVDINNNFMDFEGSSAGNQFGDWSNGFQIISQAETYISARETKDYEPPLDQLRKRSIYEIDFNRITGKMNYKATYVTPEDNLDFITQEFQCMKSEPIM